jgi:hypothetical protein
MFHRIKTSISLLVLCSFFFGNSFAEDELGAIIKNGRCAQTAGQLHTLIQPSFPSSGRGWTQKLIFLALDSAGIGSMNNSNFFKFGYKSFPLTPTSKTTAEWIFSHEGDSETETRMTSTLKYPQRPRLVFRVVRSALDNVEANYRYIKREGGNTGEWDKFASEKIQRYRHFHQYWDDRCRSTAPDAPCCLAVTYEDMQNEVFLRRALKEMMKAWLTPVMSPAKMITGADAAVDAVPPKHSDALLFPSGKRFSPSHHVALVSSHAISDR